MILLIGLSGICVARLRWELNILVKSQKWIALSERGYSINEYISRPSLHVFSSAGSFRELRGKEDASLDSLAMAQGLRKRQSVRFNPRQADPPKTATTPVPHVYCEFPLHTESVKPIAIQLHTGKDDM